MEPFVITVSADYYDSGYIPPRCRKPRTVDRSASCVVRVPQISSNEAPVAFETRNWLNDEQVIQYRWHGKRIYLPHTARAKQVGPTRPGDEHFSNQQHISYRLGDFSTDKEAIKEMRRCFGRFLIIDGEVWRQAAEPCYSINTFGLGGNHVKDYGTSLSVDSVSGLSKPSDCDFRADEYELAQERATETALGRGDTTSIERIQNPVAPIRVLIPEAISFKSRSWKAARRAAGKAKRDDAKRDEVAQRGNHVAMAAHSAGMSPAALLLDDDD